LTSGWHNKRTARGNATTSWRDKTMRGRRKVVFWREIFFVPEK
jgi:hypothetical protein